MKSASSRERFAIPPVLRTVALLSARGSGRDGADARCMSMYGFRPAGGRTYCNSRIAIAMSPCHARIIAFRLELDTNRSEYGVSQFQFS